MVTLTVTGKYTAKDQRKADIATKFIGRGSAKSSTAQYAKDFGVLANCGHYEATDRVFVSVEGNRAGRIGLDYAELDLALAAGAHIIADKFADRERPYNVGEQELAAYLLSNNYQESADGIWKKQPALDVPQIKPTIGTKPMKQFTGIEYLAIDIANHFGLDKELFEDRIAWVKDNLPVLEFLTDKADEPQLYVKAVMALRRALEGKPIGHMVALDACCSGIQIMSALTGCFKGAHATGLVDPELRADAYTLITDTLNKLLRNSKNYNEINVERADAKDAIMPCIYGSTAKPKEYFGEGELLELFYRACKEEAHGAFELLNLLRATWQKGALQHRWQLPDGFMANVKVMQKVETRVHIDELFNYNMTIESKVNEGSDFGVSNVANIIHSVDAYVLRELVRRCNYNDKKIERVRQIIQKHLSNLTVKPLEDEALNYYFNLANHHGTVSIVVLDYITAENVAQLHPLYLQELLAITDYMVTYTPFMVSTVHDAFAALPNNCNHLRYWYKELLAELADSTVIQYLIQQVTGNYNYQFRKHSTNLADAIRHSNYAIC